MDKITLERIDTAHPKVRAELAKIYGEICARLTGRALCRFAFVLRTFDEQAALYAQGRTKPGQKVTNAKAGYSLHNYGLAVDIVLIIDGKAASWNRAGDFDGDKMPDWMEVVETFKAHGWEWGGDWRGNFKDFPHFQKTFNHKEADLLALHTAGKVDASGYVLI